MLGKALLTAATGMMAGGEGLGVEDVFSTYLYTGNGGTQKISNGIGLGPTFVLGKTYRKAFNASDKGVTFTFTAQPGDVLVVHVTAGTVANGNNTTITINGLQVSSASIFDPGLNYFYRTAITPVSGTVTYSVTTDAFFMDVAVFTVSPAVAGSTPSVSVQSNYALTGQDTYAVSSFASNGYAIAINVSREVFSTYVDPGFSVFTENTNNLWATTINAIPGNGTTVPNATIKGLGTAYNDPVIVLNVANSGTSPVDDPGEGGLVWRKARTQPSNTGFFHQLIDTERGLSQILFSNTADAQTSAYPGLVRFDPDGFTMAGGSGVANQSGDTYASWTFRKAPKFFDVVTWTSDGTSSMTIPHALDSVPGCVIIKQTNASGNWFVQHRSLSNGFNSYILLNGTGSEFSSGSQVSVSSSALTVGSFYSATAGRQFVAYVFAHDAGGFGDDGNDNVVSCGSFTYSAGTTVNLGWEPQWILIKRTDGVGDWSVVDTQREWTADGNSKWLDANTSDAESVSQPLGLAPTSTGFRVPSGYGTGATFIYIAIRRGPMKTPTDATKVFDIELFTEIIANGTNLPTGFPVDLIGQARYSNNPSGLFLTPRLTTKFLPTFGTNSEASNDLYWDRSDGIGINSFFNNSPGTLDINYLFRRAPGFFDVVAWTGTGGIQAYNHNLDAVPELIIQKRRDFAGAPWLIYSSALGNDKRLSFDSASSVTDTTIWGNTTPTSTTFTTTGGSGGTNISYLFATCPGVSKVGSYTGTGTTLDIDCGFTSGARFVLIKRTDSTGDWYVWDTARGIVSGNDPYFFINSSAGQDTTKDYIDPLSSGFQISSTAPAAINANGGSFIFLAIA